jgi:hypothetical protein
VTSSVPSSVTAPEAASLSKPVEPISMSSEPSDACATRFTVSVPGELPGLSVP